MRLCSVDIISSDHGAEVLEVNAGIMLEHVTGWHPQGEALADRIYHRALDEVFGN